MTAGVVSFAPFWFATPWPLFTLYQFVCAVLVAPLVLTFAIARLASRRRREGVCGSGPVVAALVLSGITTLCNLLLFGGIFVLAVTMK